VIEKERIAWFYRTTVYLYLDRTADSLNEALEDHREMSLYAVHEIKEVLHLEFRCDDPVKHLPDHYSSPI
jgi:hypothetical protein